jgi:hypothetical protein
MTNELNERLRGRDGIEAQDTADAERDLVIAWLLDKKKAAFERWDGHAMYNLGKLIREIADNEHRKGQP